LRRVLSGTYSPRVLAKSIAVVSVLFLMTSAEFGCSRANKKVPTGTSASSQSATRSSCPQDKVDTLEYFISSHTLVSGLNGTHHLSQSICGTSSTYFKWWDGDDSTKCTIFEVHTWDTDFINLVEDHEPANFYTRAPGHWLMRCMAVGDSFDGTSNQINYGSGCSPVSQAPFRYTNTLESQGQLDLGGSLGAQDVIVLKYDYGDHFERFTYSSEWGWVKWDRYKPDGTIETNPDGTPQTATFNQCGDKLSCQTTPCGAPSCNPCVPNCTAGACGVLNQQCGTPDGCGGRCDGECPECSGCVRGKCKGGRIGECCGECCAKTEVCCCGPCCTGNCTPGCGLVTTSSSKPNACSNCSNRYKNCQSRCKNNDQHCLSQCSEKVCRCWEYRGCVESKSCSR